MINSFIFSFNATLPVFLVMVVGIILKKTGVFSEEYAAMTDKFVFKAALPLLLFKDVSSMDFSRDFDVKFLLFCMLATIAMFLVVWGLSVVLIKDKSIVGSFAQGSARGSAAILGIALAQNIYGSSGLAPLMVLGAVPLFNVLSVIILSVHSDDGKKCSPDLKNILKNIAKNPIIWGAVAGIPFLLLPISLPVVVTRTIESVSSVATPMALLAVGASFKLSSAKEKLLPALAASFIKLFVLPAVFLPIAVLFGFRNSALTAIFIMVGAPTTISCYIMSKNMGNDYVLSSNIIMLSTLFSSVSVTFWVFVLKAFALI